MVAAPSRRLACGRQPFRSPAPAPVSPQAPMTSLPIIDRSASGTVMLPSARW